MSKKQYHHYVPRFYLKYFSSNKSYISMYRISENQQVPQAPIKRTAGHYDLYGKDNEIENWLAKLESQWSLIINSIISEKSIDVLNQSQYILILAFIYISKVRTKKIADKMGEFITDCSKIIAQLAKANNKLENVAQDTFNEVLKYTKWNIDVPNYPYLHNVNSGIQLISDLYPVIFFNNSGTDFITSDNPVVHTNLLVREWAILGLQDLGTMIFVHLSPKICLCLLDPIVYNVEIINNNIFNPHEINFFNSLLVHESYETIYHSDNTNIQYIQQLIENSRSLQKNGMLHIKKPIQIHEKFLDITFNGRNLPYRQN